MYRPARSEPLFMLAILFVFALCGFSVGLAVQSPSPSDRQITVPAGRAVYVQISDEEFRRVNFRDIFLQEFPEAFVASGGNFDLPAFYGCRPYTVKGTNVLDDAKSAGWLMPIEFIEKHGEIFRRDGDWQPLADGLPQPAWLAIQKAKHVGGAGAGGGSGVNGGANGGTAGTGGPAESAFPPAAGDGNSASPEVSAGNAGANEAFNDMLDKAKAGKKK